MHQEKIKQHELSGHPKGSCHWQMKERRFSKIGGSTNAVYMLE